jgi:hypothetical protein
MPHEENVPVIPSADEIDRDRYLQCSIPVEVTMVVQGVFVIRSIQKYCMIEYRFLQIYVSFCSFIRTFYKIFRSRVQYTSRQDQNIGLYRTYVRILHRLIHVPNSESSHSKLYSFPWAFVVCRLQFDFTCRVWNSHPSLT